MMVRASMILVLFGVTLASPATLFAQEPKPEDFAKIMEKFGTPGPEHKNLEPMIGTWKVTGKFWMKPDGEPMTSDGTAVRSWILGKRFVAETFKGSALGQPFTGMSWTGYDRFGKKYLSTWIDSMGTSMENSQGTFDPKKKTFTFTSESDDPFTGTKGKNKSVIRYVSDDEHIIEMFRSGVDGSNEFRMMELRCVRTAEKTTKKAID